MKKPAYKVEGLSGFAARILHEDFDEPTRDCVKKSIEADPWRILHIPGVGRITFNELMTWSGADLSPTPGTWESLSTRAQSLPWKSGLTFSNPPTKDEIRAVILSKKKLYNLGKKTLDELRVWCGLPVTDEVKPRCPHCGQVLRK